MKKMLTIAFILLLTVTFACGSKNYEKVKLENVQALTLKANKMTTGRRSAPVPQLACLSNCHGSLPHTVQCINSGWDGSSIQWECKADLEEGSKFGDLAVICEGYDYPDDPYILAGSCGLEYTLVSDKSSGYEKHKTDYGWQQDILGSRSKKSGFGVQDMIALGAIAVIIYAVYKTCIARPTNRNTQESPTDSDIPPDDRQYPNMGWNIPGMGTNQGYGQGNYAGGGASCGTPGMGRQRGAGGGGGFWTGLATGGLMGYMFGGNRGGGYQQQHYSPRPSSSGFFGGSQSSFSSSSSSGQTRPSTGFAETRRR